MFSILMQSGCSWCLLYYANLQDAHGEEALQITANIFFPFQLKLYAVALQLSSLARAACEGNLVLILQKEIKKWRPCQSGAFLAAHL